MGKSAALLKDEVPKRVGIWIRVSTDDQARGESPEHHERRARMLAEAKGWEVATTYDLSGVSGKTVAEHPECRRMLKDVASGAISALVFSKLARLARNTKELLEFAEYFGKHSADLISLGESIDTSTPAGRLFYTVIAAMAQWERDEISERVQATVPIRAKMGKSTGGKPALGYHWQDGKIVPHPDEAPIRRLVYELFAEHKRKKKVARILNDRGFRTRQGTGFSDTSVNRLLNDSTAIGEHRANYLRNMGKGKTPALKPETDWVIRPVEPIVTRELWNECQRILREQAADKPVRRTTEHLFSGYVFCSCGGRMYPKGKVGKYICRACSNRIPPDDLEAVFHGQLHAFFLSEEQLAIFLTEGTTAIAAKQEEVSVLEREAKKLRADLLRLSETLTGSLSKDDIALIVQPTLKRLKELNDGWPKAQAELDLLKINHANSDYVIAGARDLYGRWSAMSFEEKRGIVETIVERIVVSDDEVEIHLHYLPQGSGGTTGGSNEPQAGGGNDAKSQKTSLETAGYKATNACKCGGGPGAFQCRKGPACQANYFSRISGPFLDRIDLFVDVAQVTATDLALPAPAEGTAEAAARVAKARDIQLKRYGESDARRRAINADTPGSEIEALCRLDDSARALVAKAAEQMSLSARAYYRVLKVARTIADLDGATHVARVHAAEALTYRFRPAIPARTGSGIVA